MWPATTFSVVRRGTMEQSSNLKFVDKRVKLLYIWLTEVLKLDKVHLPESND